jgi:four helix bundle protein
MGNIKSYKDLIVWQKSILLVKSIYILTDSFPNSENFILSQQIKRSAISIPSNIAEGWGRNSSGNYIHFLKIATGSLCELETQLIIAVELNFTSTPKIEHLIGLIEEISKMLKSLINTIEKPKEIETTP